MEKTCPRCGKVVVVSAEEVAMREGVAVCPQCLAVFDMDGNVHTPQVNSRTRKQVFDDAPVDSSRPIVSQAYAAPAPVAEAYRFCPECGKPLPDGVKFCPYCGQRLAAGATMIVKAPVASPAVSQTVIENTPAEEERILPPAAKWAPVFPTVHYRMRKWGAGPASLRARFVGYTAIFVLLALFAFIVYQGMLISD